MEREGEARGGGCLSRVKGCLGLMEVVEGLGGVSDGGVRTRRWEKEVEKDWGEGVGRSGKKRWKNMGEVLKKFEKMKNF